MNIREEQAAGVERFGTSALPAFRSLAKHAGVSIDVVLRHAENGTLKALVAGRVAERRATAQHVAMIERLYDHVVRDIRLGGSG